MDGTKKYTVIKLLDRGRFGPVSLVRCATTKKKFVMKEIDLRSASEQEQKSAFLEASLLATLHHPNIVSYVEAYHQSNGRLYILMKYCEGGDLYSVIRRQKDEYFPEELAANWLVQICLALKHLHDNKILHRDLKTKNIFLSHSGCIKVGDLGIARVLKHKYDMATTVVGTPGYMSPEIFCNKPYNHKSDIWSLGCCMYEIATLEQAFNAFDLYSLMQNVLQGNVTVVPKHYSADFVKLISSFLAHDPIQRPSVGDILLSAYVRQHIMNSVSRKDASFRTEREKSVHFAKRILKSRGSVKSFAQTPDTAQAKLGGQTFSVFELINGKNRGEFTPSSKTSSSSSVSLSSAVTTPDINGNGDGNDNSQRTYTVKVEVFPIIEAAPERKLEGGIPIPSIYVNRNSPSPYQSVNERLPPRNNSKENIDPEEGRDIFLPNHSSTAQSVVRSKRDTPKLLPKKPSTSTSAYKMPKKSGEISLDFLSNLNQAMKRARDADSYSLNPSFSGASTTLCLHSPSLPNLRESCCLCETPSEYQQKSRFLHDTVVKVVTSCSAPLVCRNSIRSGSFSKKDTHSAIKHDARDDSLLLPALSESNLVLPQVLDVLFPQGSSDVSSKDANIDKGLIKHIVTCNKSGLTNFAARQRRREKMTQFAPCTITKSAPASVETFPAI